MDKTSYDLLNKIDSIQAPTLFDCNLKENVEQYRYLLRQHYICQISRNKLQLRITLAGKEALEKYRIQEHLLLLQDENLKLQKSLSLIHI